MFITARRRLTPIAPLVIVTLVLASTSALAESSTGQVFFRGAWASLDGDRGEEVFTDTAAGLGTANANDGDTGYAVGAGLDLRLMGPDDMPSMPIDLATLGQIYVEYSEFSDQRVVQTASALLAADEILPAPALKKVSVSELQVAVAPKLLFNSEGTLRPWLIPVGLAFLVNSPPSDNASYLDIGLHFGGGIEVELGEAFAVGADVRYNLAFERSDTDTSYLSAGGYVGINF